jgi:chaperonin GroES
MKLRPLNDHVIVKPITEEEATSKAGIVLPETVDKEKPEKGEVMEVGPGKLLDNGERASMSLKKGDKVVFKKYSPDEINVGDDEYLVLREDDVLAAVDEE